MLPSRMKAECSDGQCADGVFQAMIRDFARNHRSRARKQCQSFSNNPKTFPCSSAPIQTLFPDGCYPK